MARNPRPRKNTGKSTPRVAGRSRRPADEPTTPAEDQQGTDGPNVYEPKIYEPKIYEPKVYEPAATDDTTDATPEDAADTDSAETPAADDSAADDSATGSSVSDPSDATAAAAADDVAADATAADDVAADATAADDVAADATAADATAADQVAADEITETVRPTGKTRPVSRVSTLRPNPDSANRGPADRPDASRSGRRGRSSTPRTAPRWPLSRRAITLLIAVAAVLGVFAVVAAFHPGANLGDDKAFVDPVATSELTSQANETVCGPFSATSTNTDAWVAKTRGTLTGRALDEFNKYLPQQLEVVNQSKAAADCKVDALGVKNLSADGNDAIVVVNLIVSETRAGMASGSGTLRIQYGMTKQDDDWRIASVEAF
ncbi:hypothetical protein [Gordonia soli]|uniref:Mce-associated membrane protein n=1 Tax=Gordonia soli NBRC 108243 TaxID=1223545 RepID=M0QH15_9ACTN|nr:hypothetical protein [Gordonia soli]GAC67905.1 hypothetical protein GS4_11_01740 [Gordonia soli NBRC 108243]